MGYVLKGYVLKGYVLKTYVLVGYVLKGYVLKRYVLTGCIVQNTPTIFRKTLRRNVFRETSSGRPATPVSLEPARQACWVEILHARDNFFTFAWRVIRPKFLFFGGSGLVCVVWGFGFGLVARLLLFRFGQQVAPLVEFSRTVRR